MDEAFNGKMFSEFLGVNVPEFWPRDIWQSSKPGANGLDYFVWSICEGEVNKKPHSNKDSVKIQILCVVVSMNKEILIKACSRFRN